MYLIFGFIIVCTVLLLLFASKSNKPKHRVRSQSQSHKQGKLGEQIVQQHYCDFFCQNSTKMINDSTFLMKNGHTTQVDHILVSEFGIFVIETKNYQGLIFGQEKQKKWTVCLGPNKYSIQNPLRQNYLHLKVLMELLKSQVSEQNFHSVVVFVGQSEFKTDMPASVCMGEHWVHHVKNFKKRVLSQQEVREVARKIERNALQRGFETDCKHRDSLNRRHGRRSTLS